VTVNGSAVTHAGCHAPCRNFQFRRPPPERRRSHRVHIFGKCPKRLRPRSGKSKGEVRLGDVVNEVTVHVMFGGG
jgi:hypothetical protein